MQRRLSAILAADVVDYSRLIGEDQVGTLAALRLFRNELFAPTVAGFRGTVIKSMGDGWLVEFASAGEAVDCAIQIQSELASHESIRLRIGIHIGDVFREDEDIFGDTVNIAARLEEVAPGGSILISDHTYSNLDGTLTPSFRDDGTKTLKNIKRPLQIWGCKPAPKPDARDLASVGGKDAAIGFPRLSVKPISTSDERGEMRGLADAMTYDVSTFLDTSHWLKVNVSESQDGSEYRLAIALRTQGEKIRLDAQLTTAKDGTVWREKFDGAYSDVFDWQDKTVEAIVLQVSEKIFVAETSRIEHLAGEEMTAADWYIGALFKLDSFFSGDSFAKVLAAIAQAKRIAPEDLPAREIEIVLLSSAITFSIEIPGVDAYKFIRRAVEEAMALPGHTLERQRINVHCGNILGFEAQKRRYDLEQVLRLDPISTNSLFACGYAALYLGEPDIAIDCLRKVLRTCQYGAYAKAARIGIAVAYVMTGKDEAAIKLVEAEQPGATTYQTLYLVLAAANGHLGNTEEAAAGVEKLLRIAPTETISKLRTRLGFVDRPTCGRYFKGLRLAGLPE